MKKKIVRHLVRGTVTFMVVLLCITTAYGASITIGGDSTDMGTIVFVTPKPGDTAAANGAALRNTMNRITGTADNPYLIKLGPGIYNLGTCGTPFTCALYMKPYVSIEGSGEKATKITASVSDSAIPPSGATVVAAPYAELRFLTVENTGAGSVAVPILIDSSWAVSLIHVTASASTATNVVGIFANESDDVTLTNVTADVSGVNSVGVMRYGGTVKITQSVIKGEYYTILSGFSGTVYVTNTQLAGGPAFAGGLMGGTITCAGVYDEAYNFHTTGCF